MLWCLAIRHAILTGVVDARIGLQHIDSDRRDLWASRLDVAEASQPSDFANNGWVVEALQGAWSAIATTPVPQDDPAAGVFRVDHLRLALDAAVRGGITSTPSRPSGVDSSGRFTGRRQYQESGDERCTAGRGCEPATSSARWQPERGRTTRHDLHWVTPVQHPHDDGVWLADAAALLDLPSGVDAVVSLCRVNDDDLADGVEQIDIRLIDAIDPDANPNLDFVLTDTVRLIEQLRIEGRTVLLHCVACQSRTPTVAALYGARRQGISGELALQAITEVLPDAWPNADFRKAIGRLAP